jgi:hypothetical protein
MGGEGTGEGEGRVSRIGGGRREEKVRRRVRRMERGWRRE